jgi:hypothetical protein
MVPGNVRTVGAQNSSAQESAKGEATQENTGTMEVKCGPLLNYRRMENETWYGSVLVVTTGRGLGESPQVPELIMKIFDPKQSLASEQVEFNRARGEPYGVVNGVDYGGFEQSSLVSPLPSSSVRKEEATGAGSGSEDVKVKATKLYSDPANTFWRFDLRVPMQQSELHCEYDIPALSFTTDGKRARQSFFVPAISESMRIMFHSCNGFSVGTDEAAWSGPALWNDVLRVHEKTPFHVMYKPQIFVQYVSSS